MTALVWATVGIVIVVAIVICWAWRASSLDDEDGPHAQR